MALKFFIPVLQITSPDHLDDVDDESDDDNNLTQASELLSLAKSSLLIGGTSNQTKISDIKSNKMFAFGKREKPY